jgi:hypothetical protein
MNFSYLDIIIIVVYLVGVAAFGILKRRQAKRPLKTISSAKLFRGGLFVLPLLLPKPAR